ncbi:hypothetical protein VTN49DRAFT_7578 [Thermomyces lanuginosus]|uniref:uncharacterized protein n=1 Tax=Thermomyces lanuginosus TaxID=5541 RepID=UPI003742EA91
MRYTRYLLSPNTVRLTLFTRAHCGLCDTAKRTLSKIQQQRQIDYKEVDIMAPENKRWKDVYEFDVPVLHVEPAVQQNADSTRELRKLFHRFTEQEVEKAMDEIKS